MPIPPNHRHPIFDGANREQHHHQDQPPVYHHQSRPHQPPYHHHHSRPDLPTYHEHVLNRRRDNHLKAMREEFMEIQRKSNQNLESMLEFLRYDLDGKFGSLSDQVERVDSRCIKVEEERTDMGIKLSDSSLSKPLGEVKNIQLDFGECIVPTDFYVVVMGDPEDQALSLGRPFLATAGAIMDWPNRRVSLANVDKDTFSDVAPPGFSSKRFRYTSGGEGTQVRGQPHGYLIKEVLESPSIPNT